MAKYTAKSRIFYQVEVETNAKDALEAETKVNQAIDDHLATIGGNYSGTTIEVKKQNRRLLSLYVKSDEQAQKTKRGEIVSYIAQLDSEGIALLRDLIVGE